MRNTSYHLARLHQDRRKPFGIGIFAWCRNLRSKWISSYLSHIYARSIRLCLLLLIICVTFMVPSCHSICIWLQDWEVDWIFFWGFPSYFTCLDFFRRYATLLFPVINYPSSFGILLTFRKNWGFLMLFLKTQDESQSIHCYSLHPSYFLQLLLH